MTTDTSSERRVVEAALQRIRVDIDGTHTDADLTQLYGRAVIAEAQKTLSFAAFRRLVAVVQMHMGLLTIVGKLDWLNARRETDLDVPQWMAFAASDIVAFHILTRSLFDEIAGFVREIAPRPGVIPDRGFRALRDWLPKRPDNAVHLGVAGAAVVTSCDWFADLRNVRDDIVHYAALTLVFPEPGRILFQVQRGPAPRILIPGVMFNETVADFTLYGSLVLARLDDFFAQLADALFKTVDSLRDIGPQAVCNRHPGLAVLTTWLENLLASLEPPESPEPPRD